MCKEVWTPNFLLLLENQNMLDVTVCKSQTYSKLLISVKIADTRAAKVFLIGVSLSFTKICLVAQLLGGSYKLGLWEWPLKPRA